nr:GNAT family N-acetyltransferase [Paenibacillus apiarius]
MREVSFCKFAYVKRPGAIKISIGFYTAPEHRKQGYASALVAELCSIIQKEELIPVLYADRVNPDSNNVYRKIGFTERGIIREMAFVQN